MADNFNGYAALLRKIKQRVLVAQQRAIYAANEEMLRMYWYMVQSITSHWNTRYLQEAIKLDDYGKHGALANNFTETLPVPEVNDVKSMLKDPYIFDMLTFTDQYNERDVEIGLVKHVEKFLVEMLCKPLHKSSYANKFIMQSDLN